MNKQSTNTVPNENLSTGTQMTVVEKIYFFLHFFGLLLGVGFGSRLDVGVGLLLGAGIGLLLGAAAGFTIGAGAGDGEAALPRASFADCHMACLSLIVSDPTPTQSET
jgi:hypothetical protein